MSDRNYLKGSMIEQAYKTLENCGMAMKFPDLWNAVKAELEIPAEEEMDRIGHFYTDLSLASGTFIRLDGNIWDLRSRHAFKPDLTDAEVYNDMEAETDDDAIELKEESEYNASVRGGLVDGGVSDTGATDGEGLDDAGNVGINDYIGGHDGNIGEDY